MKNSSGIDSLNSSLGRTLGGKKQGQQVVHQPDCQLAQRKNRASSDQRAPVPGEQARLRLSAPGMTSKSKMLRSRQREPKYDPFRMREPVSSRRSPATRPVAERGPQLMLSLSEQIVADVSLRGLRLIPARARSMASARHFRLIGVRAPGDLLDDLPAAVARAEVLLRVAPDGSSPRIC